MLDIAIWGQGHVDRADVLNLVKEYTKDIEEGFRFLIPISEPQSKAALWVAEWAQVQGHAYYIFDDLADDYNERQTSVMDSAVRETVSLNLVQDMVSATGSGVVLAAMDEEEATETFLDGALRRGARAYDLTDALAELVLEDEDEEDDDIPNDGSFPTVLVEAAADPTLTEILSALERLERKVEALRERAVRA